MEISVTVCDVEPKPGEDTKHYTITQDGRAVELDLCAAHSEAMERLMLLKQRSEVAPPAPATRKVAAKKSAPRRRRGVVTLDEIEAMKS
jgi:hypothetical protein